MMKKLRKANNKISNLDGRFLHQLEKKVDVEGLSLIDLDDRSAFGETQLRNCHLDFVSLCNFRFHDRCEATIFKGLIHRSSPR